MLLRTTAIHVEGRLLDRLLRPGAYRRAIGRAVSGSEEAATELTFAAEAFLRAGGSVSLAEWARLLPVERAALTAAGVALAAEAASAAGLASQGPLQAAAVLAPADDGQARNGILLADAVARAVASARAAEPAP